MSYLVRLVLLLLAVGVCACVDYTGFELENNQVDDILIDHLNGLILKDFEESQQDYTLCYRAIARASQYRLHSVVNELLRRTAGIPIELNSLHMRLVFVDSYEALRYHLHERNSLNVYSYAVKYLILYLPSPSEQNISQALDEMFALLQDMYIIDVNVLVPHGGIDFQLYTYFPFKPEQCWNAKPVLLHTLWGAQRVEVPSLAALYPQKANNLYGCQLSVVSMPTPPFMIYNPEEEGDRLDGITGIDGTILKDLARKMNFTIKLITAEVRGDVDANGTVTGMFKYLTEHRANFTIGDRSCYPNRMRLLSFTQPYLQTAIRIFIKPHHLYEPMGFLLYPFYPHIWSLLVATIAMRSATLLLFRRRIHLMPRTFRRFIFAMWLIMMFYYRSSYEALYFVYLRHHPVTLMPGYIHELGGEGYKILADNSIDSYLQYYDGIRDVIIKRPTDAMGTLQYLEQIEGNYGIVMKREYFGYYLKTRPQVWSKIFTVAQPISENFMCIYFPSNSYLVKPIDRVLHQLRSFGFVIKYRDFFIALRAKPMRASERSDLQRITRGELHPMVVGTLTIVFKLMATSLGFAFLILLAELIAAKRRRVATRITLIE